MAHASRIFSIVLGLAVIALFLWPFNSPLGLGRAWWAKEIAVDRKAEGQPATVPTPVPPTIAALPVPAEPPAPPPPPVQQTAPQPVAPASQVHAIPDPAAPPQLNMLASEKAETERLAALQKDKAADAAPPVTKLYYKVRVIDAGTIQSGGVVITLADIAARDAKANCKDAKGRPWGCGDAGRVALARLIRTRAVSCVLPKGAEQKAFAARCNVAGTDLSTWLVRQGWANPKEPSEKALADAEAAAKKEKIGIWRGSQ
jgi:endonuclease YncB( thermonuclease family)